VLTGPLTARRNEFIHRLNQVGVGTSVYYPQPVPRMTYYRNKYGYDASQYPNAVAISDHSVALPVGPHLTADDVAYIGQTFVTTIQEMMG
jgi:dTDP-4-amino-4,6-dideoxygalactose transaminase